MMYRLLLAAFSGVCTLIAFPPYDIWWAAIIGVALLSIAVYGQSFARAFWLAGVHGVVFFLLILRWSGLYVGWWPHWLLSGVQALYIAAMGVLLVLLMRCVQRVKPAWVSGSIIIATVCAWVLQEALRSRAPFGGFPWGRLSFSQTESPLLPAAAYIGAVGLGALVALGGSVVAAGWISVAEQRARLALPLAQAWHAPVSTGLAGALLLMMALTGFSGVSARADAPAENTRTVAVVQGNVPRAGLDFNAQRRAVLDNHARATRALAAQVVRGEKPQPDMVIWPENSSDIDPLKNADAARVIDEAATAIDAPILIGAVLEGPGEYVSNAGLVWEPGIGVRERYNKQHPVPFAEYVPYRSVLRNITTKVDLVRSDFYPGDTSGVLTLGDARIGDVICFEVAYDSLVSQTVQRGAELLVVQTNNATFGRSHEAAQQLAMVRLRAVEHGRYSLMASTTGISAIIDPAGRVLDETELFTEDVLVAEVELRRNTTLATHLGVWPEIIAAVVAVAILALAAWRHGPSRRLEKPHHS